MLDIIERVRTSTANKNQGSNWIRRTTRVKLYKRDGWKCRYCGKRVTQGGPLRSRATLDHMDGVHKNNAHDNLQTVCQSCNSKKQGKSDKEFKDKLDTSKQKRSDAGKFAGKTGGRDDDYERDDVGRFTFKKGGKTESEFEQWFATMEQVAAACDEFFLVSRG